MCRLVSVIVTAPRYPCEEGGSNHVHYSGMQLSVSLICGMINMAMAGLEISVNLPTQQRSLRCVCTMHGRVFLPRAYVAVVKQLVLSVCHLSVQSKIVI